MNALTDYAMFIRDAYHHCHAWIDEALKYTDGLATHESVLNGLLLGTYQIWPGERCVVITEIQNFDGVKVLRLFVIGGNLKEALSKAPAIFGWAKHTIGCQKVRFDGREGWKKIATEYGFKPIGIVMSADMDDLVREN